MTITANAQSKTYGQTVTFGAGSTLFTESSGLENGETIGSVTLAVTNNGGAATADVGSYTITASAATGGTFSASNYNITYDTGTLTVNTAALTITASDQSKTYGQTVTFSSGSAQFTSSGLENGETIGSVTLAVSNNGGAATADVGSYTITASSPTGGTFDAGNYSITYDTGTLTVNTAALTITASDQSKTYRQTVTFSSGSTQFTSSGLENGETIGSVTLAVSNNGGAATAHVGSYTMTASSPTGGTFDAGNYNITYDTGTLTVNTAALTITASDQSKTYGNEFEFAGTEFTTSGLVNGNTVTSAIIKSAGAPANADVSATPYSITINAANGTGLSNYIITYIDGRLTVNPKALTITALNDTKTYGDTFIFAGTEFTTSGLVNGDVVTNAFISSPAIEAEAPVSGSPYEITISGANGLGIGNYRISYVDGLFTVSPRVLTIHATAQSKVYDGTTTAQVTLSDNRITGDEIADFYAIASFLDDNVGMNKIVLVIGLGISGPDVANYVLSATTVSTIADITARPPTVSAAPAIIVSSPSTGQILPGRLVSYSGPSEGTAITLVVVGEDHGSRHGAFGSSLFQSSGGGQKYEETPKGSSEPTTPVARTTPSRPESNSKTRIQPPPPNVIPVHGEVVNPEVISPLRPTNHQLQQTEVVFHEPDSAENAVFDKNIIAGITVTAGFLLWNFRALSMFASMLPMRSVLRGMDPLELLEMMNEDTDKENAKKKTKESEIDLLFGHKGQSQ